MGSQPEGGGEEIGASEVGGDNGGVVLTAAEVWESRVGGGGID